MHNIVNALSILLSVCTGSERILTFVQALPEKDASKSNTNFRSSQAKRKKLTIVMIMQIDPCVYVFLRDQTAGTSPRWSHQAETCILH